MPVPLPHGPADGRGKLGEQLVIGRGELLEEGGRNGGRELAEAGQGDVAERREADEGEGGREQGEELLVRRLPRRDSGEEAGLGPLEDVAVGFGAVLREKIGDRKEKGG